MRLALFFLALVLSAHAVPAQQRGLNSFWEIPFGTSKAQAVALAKKKSPRSTFTDDGALITDYVRFGGYPGIVYLQFCAARFCNGSFTFTNTESERAERNYHLFYADIKEKYGQPDSLYDYNSGYKMLEPAPLRVGDYEHYAEWRGITKAGSAVKCVLAMPFSGGGSPMYKAYDVLLLRDDAVRQQKEDAKDY